jgi:5-formyltetrahydrofolate cyclo-ligase
VDGADTGRGAGAAAVETPSERKRTLRSRAVAARAELPPAVLAEASAAVTQRVLDLPEVERSRTVAAFISYGTELATRPLLDALTDRGVAVLLPVLLDDDDLAWRRYAGPDRLVPGRRGLLEPAADAAGDAAVETVDAVVVPGVCYDLSGRRLGRGGGSYDRALARLPAGVPRIAVALDSEVVPELPAEEHDERVDVIVTPTRVLRTNGETSR